MNVLAFIPFVFFLLLLLRSKKKNNNAAIVLLSFYTLSSFVSIFLDLEIAIPIHDSSKDSFLNFLLYSLVLSVFLSFVNRFKPFKSKDELISEKKASFFYRFLGVFGVFSFIYQLPYAIKSMLINAVDVRLELNSGDYSALPPGILTTLSTGISSFYVVYIYFFYLSLVQKKSVFTSTLMLIGVLSYIVSTLAFAGRDGVVFVAILMLVVFFLFENLLDKKKIKVFKYVYISILSVGLIFLLTITVSRFLKSDGSIYKMLNHGVFGYFGMQPFIFSDFINDFDNYTYGAKNFSVFRDLFGYVDLEIPPPKSIIEWQFGSFLASFYKPYGFSSFILISLFFMLLFAKTSLRITKVFFLQRIIITGFYFQFMVTGLFYFRLGNPGGNKYMILLLFFYFLLSLANKFQRRIR